MKLRPVALAALLLISAFAFAEITKTYKHAAQYQIATLDQNLRVETGSDVTLAMTQTDAKLGKVGQGIHLLYTADGNYRVEAPINKGMTIASALTAGMANAPERAATFHNKWFLDDVQSGTKVLFAAQCARASKKHPRETVRCIFYFPDPDSSSHEYEAIGDFTPYMVGDGSNTQKAANTLCGTGKLNPQVEAQLCGGTPGPTIASTPAPAHAPTHAPATGTIDPATGTVVQ